MNAFGFCSSAEPVNLPPLRVTPEGTINAQECAPKNKAPFLQKRTPSTIFPQA
jgi:hypothetical protein